jgi:hypothetical protein
MFPPSFSNFKLKLTVNPPLPNEEMEPQQGAGLPYGAYRPRPSMLGRRRETTKAGRGSEGHKALKKQQVGSLFLCNNPTEKADAL